MYENLTPEERKLAERFGLIKVKKKVQEQVVEETKIVKYTTTCKLCRTISVQYFLMSNKGSLTWEKAKELSASEVVKPDEAYETSVRLCASCREVLFSKGKEELVDMIIHLCNPVITGVEVWNHLKKVKEDSDVK